MSVFGPNQVEELIIGAAVATETTAPTVIASASDKEIAVVSANGSAVAAGEKFKVLQKTNGDSSKGLNYEFSDVIDPSKVEKVILKEYVAEANKKVTVTIDTAAANTTYVVECKIYNDGGSLSVENFANVNGYFVTGSVAPTKTVIRDGIIAALQADFTRRGNSEVVIAASSTDKLTITGKAQSVVAGKITGRQIEFDVTGRSFLDSQLISENTELISTVVDNGNNPGAGTGKYAVNLEWFTKGYKYEVYRTTGFPADFGERTPYYADSSKAYNAIHIKYKSDRISPTVEEQPKVLTILVERANLAGNSVTNAVLAKLRTAIGTGNVPVNLLKIKRG